MLVGWLVVGNIYYLVSCELLLATKVYQLKQKEKVLCYCSSLILPTNEKITEKVAGNPCSSP